jgi:hypothetical protein
VMNNFVIILLHLGKVLPVIGYIDKWKKF